MSAAVTTTVALAAVPGKTALISVLSLELPAGPAAGAKALFFPAFLNSVEDIAFSSLHRPVFV